MAKAYSKEHNKKKYRKQREDAEKRGDKATLSKIESKTPGSTSLAKSPSRTERMQSAGKKASKSGPMRELASDKLTPIPSTMSGMSGGSSSARGKVLSAAGKKAATGKMRELATDKVTKQPKEDSPGNALVGAFKSMNKTSKGLIESAAKKSAENKKKGEKGYIGDYKGPKPRAYSSLSAKDKKKEDDANERELKGKKR